MNGQKDRPPNVMPVLLTSDYGPLRAEVLPPRPDLVHEACIQPLAGRSAQHDVVLGRG